MREGGWCCVVEVFVVDFDGLVVVFGYLVYDVVVVVYCSNWGHEDCCQDDADDKDVLMRFDYYAVIHILFFLGGVRIIVFV